MRALRRLWPLVLLALLVGVGALLRTSNHGEPTPRQRAAPSAPGVARTPAIVPEARVRPPVGGRSATAAAKTFALSYVRYLDGRASAAALMLASTGVRLTARLAGPIPVGARAGRPRLERLGPTTGSSASSARLTLVAADRKHTYSAQLSLSATVSGWIVTGLVPPDYPTVLGTGHPRTPRAPAAAEVAAAAFINTYVRFTYGQLSARAIRAVSSALGASLAEDPPRVPNAIRRLHPRIGRPVLEWGRGADTWRGWAAVARVNDGLNSYQVAVLLDHAAGGWLAVRLLPTG